MFKEQQESENHFKRNYFPVSSGGLIVNLPFEDYPNRLGDSLNDSRLRNILLEPLEGSKTGGVL